MNYESTKIIELGSCAFRQWRADSHCRFIHGYRLQAKFWFGASSLDDRNWVVDFGGLKALKQVLEKQFDHTFCVAEDDPKLELFKQMHNEGVCDLRIMPKGVGIERTAEWCFDVADAHVRGLTKGRCWVERVEVWEHEKNSAIAIANKECCEDRRTSCKKHQAEQYEFKFEQAVPVPQHNETISTSIQPEQIRPANVGNTTTSGYGNMFKGTTWSS